MSSPTLYINGKFTAQRTTGVQRVAAELVRAIDLQVSGRCVLLCPPSGRPPALKRIEVQLLGHAGLPLHAWEQWSLPQRARDGLLLNLAGAAPAAARRQLCMLHDAAVFDHPEAYTPSFVAWYRWLFRRLSRRGAGLMTVSRFSQSRLSLHLKCAADAIAVVHPGADHLEAVEADSDVLRIHRLQPQGFLLAVTSGASTKNLAALLVAFAALRRRPGMQLVVVGAGSRRVFATVVAADPPGVIRTGPLGDRALKALYAAAAALVFPSLYEGFGLPPLEAMACGCPVAVARAASMPEACADAAAYFDPRSPADIVAVIDRLLDNADERSRLRRAGLLQAASFRWHAAAERLLQIAGNHRWRPA